MKEHLLCGARSVAQFFPCLVLPFPPHPLSSYFSQRLCEVPHWLLTTDLEPFVENQVLEESVGPGTRTVGVHELALWAILDPFSLILPLESSPLGRLELNVKNVTCLGEVLAFMSILATVHTRLGVRACSCHPRSHEADAMRDTELEGSLGYAVVLSPVFFTPKPPNS